MFVLCHCILEGYDLFFISRDLTVKTLWAFEVLVILKSVTFKVGLYFNREMRVTLRTGAQSLKF